MARDWIVSELRKMLVPVSAGSPALTNGLTNPPLIGTFVITLLGNCYA
jgi:hypothetical protein